MYISVNCKKGINSYARSIKIFYPSHETGKNNQLVSNWEKNPVQIDRGIVSMSIYDDWNMLFEFVVLEQCFFPGIILPSFSNAYECFWILINAYECLSISYRSRFFDQAGDQTIYIENKYFFTKSCHHQTYHNF